VIQTVADKNLLPTALFVDFENVYYGMLKDPINLPRETALTATMESLSELRADLRSQNFSLIYERSYADWERMPPSTQRQLQILGILPRFVDGRNSKSTADIEMSLDILQQVLRNDYLQHFVLVGGDRDYLPILRRLKEQHRSICVCSLRDNMSGDIREFIKNYAAASVIELDVLIALSRYQSLIAPPSSVVGRDDGPLSSVDPLKPKGPIQIDEWHERYISAMHRFMTERGYTDIHLGPFFRWLQSERIFELVSAKDQRRIFDQLQEMGAVTVEERDTGQGYTYSVAMLNWEHALVQSVREQTLF
jgi:uncharacterized LabA/DUF88 family protein